MIYRLVSSVKVGGVRLEDMISEQVQKIEASLGSGVVHVRINGRVELSFVGQPVEIHWAETEFEAAKRQQVAYSVAS